MTSPTAHLGLEKATNSDIRRVYFTGDLADSLDTIDTRLFDNKGDIFNIRSYSNSLSTAVTAAAVGGGVVAITPGTFTVGVNLTVPSNVTLLFLGGLLSVNTGITLTINGPLQAPPRQIFTGPGTVVLSPLVPMVYPEWFGAVGDGTTNDVSALQKAVTAGGGEVGLQARTYAITSVWTINTAGAVITGKGQTSVILLNSTTAGIVGTGATNLILRDCQISSVQTSSSANGSFYAQGVSGITIARVRFVGGGHQLNLNTCTNFTIRDTRHAAPTKGGAHNITLFTCSDGVLDHPTVEAHVAPTNATTTGCIDLNTCHHVAVSHVIIDGVDLSTVPAGYGFGFSTCTWCTLDGAIIHEMKGADGIVVQGTSTDIAIDNVISEHNNASAGAGSHDETGDGIDIFNSSRVRVGNSIFRRNGAIGGHPNIEIFTSTDVTLSNVDASDGLNDGIINIGSPGTELHNVHALRNQRTGFKATNSGGTESTNIKIFGGDFTDNGQAAGAAGTVEGIYLAAATTAIIQGVRATDTRAGGSKTQTYGIRLENTARALISNVALSGNATGDYQDSVTTSSIVGRDTGAKSWRSDVAILVNAPTTAPMIDTPAATPLIFGVAGVEKARFTPAVGLSMTASRFLWVMGATVAAAATTVLGVDGNSFHISNGTGTINLIDFTNWQTGTPVLLKFGGVVTVTHNYATPASPAMPIRLAGSVNLVTAAQTRLIIAYDALDGFWYEWGRVLA